LVPSVGLSVRFLSERKKYQILMAVQPSGRARTAAAAPVVGWPPVRSFRRNLASSFSRPSPQSSSGHHRHHKVHDCGGAMDGAHKGGLFVKINMDGVPIGRKVDLTAYGGYADLSAAVGKLFRGLLAGTYARPVPVRLLQERRRRTAYVATCFSVVASS
jgi:hypothetical protein